MRVEKVNDNTLRVSMTREDLNKRGLKILDLLGNRERVQEFFLSILHEVDKEHSFASDAPVTFQVMPNDGGIDLLIAAACRKKCAASLTPAMARTMMMTPMGKSMRLEAMSRGLTLTWIQMMTPTRRWTRSS